MSSSLLSRSATDNELSGVSLRRPTPERRSLRTMESFGYGPVSPNRRSGERRESKSFWDNGDVETAVSLTTADGESWVRSQHETFVNWVNERLKSGGKTNTVTDLTEDLRDGTVLIRLVENLTGKKMKQYNKAPTVTAHKLDNLDLLFSFMRSNGIKVIGIGSHNIHAGDIKLILGLIGTLIQKYQIRMGGTQVSNKALMVDWLNALLPAWNITNLSRDWHDGRALMALISEVKPGIASDPFKLDPSNSFKNCNLAINIAFNHLKIPKLISADNLSSSSIDELSIITYLSYFRDPARARLLKWCKRMLPQFHISNFLEDWADGQAFEALARKCISDILPEPTGDEGEDVLDKKIQTMLDTLSKKLGVKLSFTAKKLVAKEVEELQIMTLVLWIKNGKLQPLANEIVVSGPGISEAVVGRESVFHIDTTRAGPGKLTLQAVYKNGKKVDCHVKAKERLITVTYSPKKAGNIEINVRWSGEDVPNSPFTVTATDVLMVKIVDMEHTQRTVCVKKPIELSINTEKAGEGVLTAQLMYEGEPPIQAEVTKSSDVITKLRYTPPVSGQPTLHIFWNGESMSHLAIDYTVMDPYSYRVVEKCKDKAYAVLERVTFKVETKGEPLNALHMAAIMEEDDVEVPIQFDKIDNGVGLAMFQPTLPGVYDVKVACVDQLVEGSPFQVAIVDTSQCKTVEEIPKYLQLRVPYTIEIDTKNAGKGELNFDCEEDEDIPVVEADITPQDESGICKVKLFPQKEGNHLVSLKFQGTEIPGSPFRIFVCNPARVRVGGEVLEKKVAMVGKPIRFKMAVDQLEDIKPVVKATGPTAKYTPEIKQVNTNPDVYAVRFTPWEIGPHEISITYGDFHIPKSPFLITVTTFDSTTCSATGSGLQKASAGIPAQFVIIAKQAGLLKDKTLKVQVQGVLTGVNSKVRARDNRNGTYTVAYLVRDPGAYLISISAEDKPIPGSPFRLTAIAGPTAENCRMYGQILQPGAVLSIGKPMDFTVDCTEAGIGELSVKAIGPGGSHARVYLGKDNKQGVFNIKLDPVRHGRYRVSVKWSDEHIPGSPFMISVYPGADASKCVAFGPGLTDGIVGKPGVFTIETKDAGAGTLKVRLHGVKDAFKINIKPMDQQNIRTLQANYNPRKPGDYLVTIKWSDKHIPGSPFRVKIDEEHNIIASDSNIKLEKFDDEDPPLTSTLLEEVDDANWGDDEEQADKPVQVQEETTNKQKKKAKKSKSSTSVGSSSITTDDVTVPSFSSTSKHTTYKDAFSSGSGGQGKSTKVKATKGRKGKK